MGRRSSVQLAVGLAIALAAACHRSPYRSVTGGKVSCEIPRAWELSPGGGPLLFALAPEQVREVGVSLSVYEGPSRSRKELEALAVRLTKLSAEDPDFKVESVAEVQAAGTPSAVLTTTRMRFAEHMHRTTPLPPPVKVRQAEVFFTVGGKGYVADYEAPEELYEKYKPAFDHLLATLRVAQ